MADDIRVLNAGSSSLKLALFGSTRESTPKRLLSGAIEGIGTAPHLHAVDAAGAVFIDWTWARDGGISHEALFASYCRGSKPARLAHGSA